MNNENNDKKKYIEKYKNFLSILEKQNTKYEIDENKPGIYFINIFISDIEINTLNKNNEKERFNFIYNGIENDEITELEIPIFDFKIDPTLNLSEEKTKYLKQEKIVKITNFKNLKEIKFQQENEDIYYSFELSNCPKLDKITEFKCPSYISLSNGLDSLKELKNINNNDYFYIILEENSNIKIIENINAPNGTLIIKNEVKKIENVNLCNLKYFSKNDTIEKIGKGNVNELYIESNSLKTVDLNFQYADFSNAQNIENIQKSCIKNGKKITIENSNKIFKTFYSNISNKNHQIAYIFDKNDKFGILFKRKIYDSMVLYNYYNILKSEDRNNVPEEIIEAFIDTMNPPEIFKKIFLNRIDEIKKQELKQINKKDFCGSSIIEYINNIEEFKFIIKNGYKIKKQDIENIHTDLKTFCEAEYIKAKVGVKNNTNKSQKLIKKVKNITSI